MALDLVLVRENNQDILRLASEIDARAQGYYVERGNGVLSRKVKILIPYNQSPPVDTKSMKFNPYSSFLGYMTGVFSDPPTLDGGSGGTGFSDPMTSNVLKNPELITWEGRLLINDAWVAANPSALLADGVTVVINARNFRAPDTNLVNNGTLNAVHIQTTQYVIEFHNCCFAGYGRGDTANGITGGKSGQRVRYFGCRFYGLVPTTRGFWRGRALIFNGMAECVVQYCDFYSTCGIAINGWSGKGRNLPNTINIQFNRFFEIDGRISDPDQPALYPGGPSGFFIGNKWGGDARQGGRVWTTATGVGYTSNFTVKQSRAITSLRLFSEKRTGGQAVLEASVRGVVIATFTFATGETDKTQTFSQAVWLKDNEDISLKITSLASGATFNYANLEFNGLPSVGAASITAVGQTGTSRVYLNHELKADGSTEVTKTHIRADSHTGGQINFQIIDRDVILNTERVIGTAVLPSGATLGTVSIALPEILRTGHQLILKSTSVAAGASCTNVRIQFYAGVQHSFVIANLLQCNLVEEIDRAIVAHNLVLNSFQNNRCEDLVSLYRTYGLSTNWFTIKGCLFIGGSEVYDPWFNINNPNHITYGDNMPLDWPERFDSRGYFSSGGQGLLGDGKGDTDLSDPAWCEFYEMTVIGSTNYSIGVSGGHDMTIRDSDVWRSGFLYGASRDVVLRWGHTGLQVQDYNTKSNSTNSVNWAAGIGQNWPLGRTNAQGQTSAPRWYNNDFIRITGGYTKRNPDGSVNSERLLLFNSPTRNNFGHTIFEGVTRVDENDAVDRHISRWRLNNIKVGLQA